MERQLEHLFFEQENYNVGTLVQLLRSPKMSRSFILVEGKWDYVLYKKLFREATVNIGRANKDGRGGYFAVEYVVMEVRKEEPKAKVFGIRDRDYVFFTDYVKPDGVFVTDEHSLEMMLLHSESVRNALRKYSVIFDKVYQGILSDAKEIAKYYVYNAIKDLKINFEKAKLHLIHFFDQNKRVLDASWTGDAYTRFKIICPTCSEKDMCICLDSVGFESVDDYVICRGHDVVGVLYEMTKHDGMEMDDLMQLMVEAYSEDDFWRTKLGRNVEDLIKYSYS